MATPERKSSRKKSTTSPPEPSPPPAPFEAQAFDLDAPPPVMPRPARRKPESTGVACPKCGCGHCPVKYTRHRMKRTIRARECRHCGKRFTTTEKLPDTFGGEAGGGPNPPAEGARVPLV